MKTIENANCLHELLTLRALRSPDSPAIVWRDQGLTYRQLDERVGALADRLTALGVGPEIPVGLCAERSLDLVVALLAILAAGGAYVPLDPTYPAERLAFMLRDSARGVEQPVLVTRRPLLARLGDLADVAPALLLLDDPAPAPSLAPPPRRPAGPENLAYVIYTSGSTGTPKGVAVEHHSACALVRWAVGLFAAEDLAGVLFSTSISFDIHVFELFVTLAAGGTIVVADNALELPTLAGRDAVTLLHTVPSVMAELLRLAAVPPSVRVVCLGGETLTGALADQVYGQTSARRLLNFYGPTEDTVWSTCAEVPRDRHREPTIGRPATGGSAHLLDGDLRPVAAGVAGEVYLGGEGVARGYLHRPALTAERFVPDPFAGTPGSRLYRVGDLARRDSRDPADPAGADGDLEFLGRVDHQVKVRGFRVELGEIEACLAHHPALHECVVAAAARPGSGEGRLVAYLVAARQPAPAAGEVRRFLAERLPAHMMPAAFVFLPVLPRLPNGKVDRGALPHPGGERPALDVAYEPPGTANETALAEIWAAQLGLDHVGLHDPLLDLGADSLTVTRLASRIRQQLGIALTMPELFAHPTVAQLAAHLDGAHAATDDHGPERAVRPAEDEIPLALPQEQVWFMCRLDPASLAYHFQCTVRFRGPLDVAALERSLNAIVERHEVYRTTFPEVDGRPVQRVHAAVPIHLSVVECGSEAEAQRRITLELRQPSDLARLPLVRWVLLRVAAQEHLLLHIEHHLLHDGWSFHVYLRELFEGYRAFTGAGAARLGPLAIQFSDYARWQHRWLHGDEARRQLEFWTRKLQGVTPNLELPADRARPPVPTFAGAAPRFLLPAGLCGRLREIARRQGATFFMAQLTAFVVLMHRYSGQLDFAVGTAVANRRWRNSEDLLGMLVNAVALRTDLTGNPPLHELLDRVRAVALEAFAHQDMPLESVLPALRLPRDASRNPLFQVLFNFHDAPLPVVPLPGLSAEVKTVISNASAKFDLNVILIPRHERPLDAAPPRDGDGATLIWEYSSDLFDPPTMGRMIEHFRSLLAQLVADPGQRLADVPLLAERERHQILREWGERGRGTSLPRLSPPLAAALERAGAALRVVDETTLEPIVIGRRGRIAVAHAVAEPDGPLGSGDPAYAAWRWLPDPCAESPGGRLLLAEDVGRWNARGALEIRGGPEILVPPDGPGAAPALQSAPPAAVAASPTPVEGRICEIWQEVLGLDGVLVTDNFFALGGHSLLAVKVLHRVHLLFAVEVQLPRLMADPTPAGLARLVSTAASEPGPSAAPSARALSSAASPDDDGVLPDDLGALPQDEVDRLLADLLTERREGWW